MRSPNAEGPGSLLRFSPAGWLEMSGWPVAPDPGFSGFGGLVGSLLLKLASFCHHSPLKWKPNNHFEAFLIAFDVTGEATHVLCGRGGNPLSKSKSRFLNDRNVWLELKTKG